MQGFNLSLEVACHFISNMDASSSKKRRNFHHSLNFSKTIIFFIWTHSCAFHPVCIEVKFDFSYELVLKFYSVRSMINYTLAAPSTELNGVIIQNLM